MKETLAKLTVIEKQTSEERGGYELFGLFKRRYFPEKWDVVVAAQWIKNSSEGIWYIAPKIQQALTSEEISWLAGVTVVKSDDPDLLDLQQSTSVEHGYVEIKKFTFSEREIDRGILITLKRNQAAEAEKFDSAS